MVMIAHSARLGSDGPAGHGAGFGERRGEGAAAIAGRQHPPPLAAAGPNPFYLAEDRLVLARAERGPACPSPAGNSSGRMAGMTLPALPEGSFQRVLCVVAHPDA